MEATHVWWTDQPEATAAADRLHRDGMAERHTLPDWLCKQFRSRMGRNGRGRLWVAQCFGEHPTVPLLRHWPNDLAPRGDLWYRAERHPDPAVAMTAVRIILQSCAGVVVDVETARLLVTGDRLNSKWPGFVTGLDLVRFGREESDGMEPDARQHQLEPLLEPLLEAGRKLKAANRAADIDAGLSVDYFDSAAEFRGFLVDMLIPDLRESSPDSAMAGTLEEAVHWIDGLADLVAKGGE